jgi:V/A-type H+-transporting ATPase subunit E
MSGSIEAIRERIIQDASQEAEQIIKGAKEKAQQILSEMEERVEETRQKRLDEGRKYAEEASERALADSQVEYRRLLSEERDRLFEEASQVALDQLREFSSKEQYLKKLQDLIVEAGIILGGGALEVSLNERDIPKLKKRALRRLAKRIQEETQTKTSLEVVDDVVDSLGGTVVSRKDENVSVDNTFEARLSRIKEEKRSEIYHILFEE